MRCCGAQGSCVAMPGADVPAFPVVAVVVTWNPDLAAFESALDSYKKICRIVIVDNGSRPQVVQALRAWASPACALVESGVNEGIATALNRGVEAGKRWSPAYYFLLDQDSVLEDGALSRLMAASERLQARGGPLPVVGPLPVARDSGTAIGMYQHLPAPVPGVPACRVESLYTSGMLVPAALAVNAPQLDAFFIDYVDTEWCYRVRALFGAETYVVPDARVFHQVGESELGLGLRSRPLLVHRPLRQYFQFRNALWMLRLPYIPWRARIRMAVRCLARVAMLALCVPPRGVRVRYIACAIVDGWRLRAGTYPFLPASARAGRFDPAAVTASARATRRA